METVPHTQEPQPAAPVRPSYAVLPPEPEPVSTFSPKFIIFTILVIGAAVAAGLYQSGRLPLHKSSIASTTSTKSALSTAAAPAVAPPKPGAFVVTSISLGQPSIVIINGKSRSEGDPVEAPGVTGWKVARIQDGVVFLQNGSTFTSIPLTTPGIKPLDDTLHPLN